MRIIWTLIALLNIAVGIILGEIINLVIGVALLALIVLTTD